MTREEQIKAASAAYTRVKCPMAIGGDRFKNMIDSINANPAFIAGAEWADKNPQSLWIDVNEQLPNDGQVVLVSYTNTAVGYESVDGGVTKAMCLTKYTNDEDRFGIEEPIMLGGVQVLSEVNYWMPIPELPKED